MDAPNFRGTYPLDGEIIGPAWKAAWEMLGTSERFIRGDELAAQMAACSGAAPKTAQNLLRKAAKAHRLEHRYKTVAGRRRVFYRRHWSYR